MKAFSGQDFILYVGAHDTEPDKLGGLRATEIHLQNHLLESTDMHADDARKLLEKAGEQALRISAQGLYTHSEAEQKVFTSALLRTPLKYSLFLGEGQKIEGDFMVSHYRRSGDFEAEEIYEIVLESTGKMRVF